MEEKDSKARMRLYSCLPSNNFLPPIAPRLISLKRTIEGKTTGCNNQLFHGPGVITENPDGSHNLFGLHSRHTYGNYTLYDETNNPGLYGSLVSPENLLQILIKSRQLLEVEETRRVINGCVIELNTILDKDRKYNWRIWISPDFDLREQYPERFDDNLVKSLEATVSKYIRSSDVEDKVACSVSPETVRLNGAAFSHQFYKER